VGIVSEQFNSASESALIIGMGYIFQVTRGCNWTRVLCISAGLL